MIRLGARSVAAMLVAFVCGMPASISGAGTRLVPQQEPGAAPRVVYSTLLGGAAGNFDAANDVAVDATGNAYVVGTTESSDFPTRNALQASLKGDSDAFVAKFGPDGELIFSTFLGGSGYESATAVAVDAAGAIYVAGLTGSPDFPKQSAFQSTLGGLADAFVTKLAPDGQSIVFSSFLGGSGDDEVEDIALDSDGMLYVAGTVYGAGAANVTFPEVNPIQESYGGGDTDAFASFVSPAGDSLVFSTLFDTGIQDGPAAGTDAVSSIRVSSSGEVYVAGNLEYDEDLPEAPFVARFHPVRAGKGEREGGPLVYLIIVDAFYEAGENTLEPPEAFGVKLSIFLLMGLTFSEDPKTAGGEEDLLVLADGLCHPATAGGTCDEPAAVAVFDPDLHFKRAENLPVLREFFVDAGTADAQEAFYIAGDISSDRLTTVNPTQMTFGGNDDVVVAALTPGSYEPAFVTFLGGDGFDSPESIAVDPQGNIYVAGLTTLSTTFPTTPGAVQSTPKGRNDAFVVKISPVGPFPEEPDFSLSFDSPEVTVARGSKVTVPLTIERFAGFDGRVTVTSPSAPAGIKLPKPKSTTGTTIQLKIKVKGNAPVGPQTFTFTGRDAEGRTRSATLKVTVG